jgi:hypothetical protein
MPFTQLPLPRARTKAHNQLPSVILHVELRCDNGHHCCPHLTNYLLKSCRGSVWLEL